MVIPGVHLREQVPEFCRAAALMRFANLAGSEALVARLERPATQILIALPQARACRRQGPPIRRTPGCRHGGTRSCRRTEGGFGARRAMMGDFESRKGGGMAMTAREFVERLNLIKASVDGGESAHLAERLQRVRLRLKETFEPEQLKAALRDDAPIPTPLEEEVTTLTMEWMQSRR